MLVPHNRSCNHGVYPMYGTLGHTATGTQGDEMKLTMETEWIAQMY